QTQLRRDGGRNRDPSAHPLSGSGTADRAFLLSDPAKSSRSAALPKLRLESRAEKNQMKSILPVALCLTLLPVASWAQDQDAEGCKDSAVITRMAGSKINSCDNQEFDQFTFPLPPDAAGNEQSKVVDGEMRTWDYGTREGVSEIQVFRNIENALKKAGFAIDYENSPVQITAHKGT